MKYYAKTLPGKQGLYVTTFPRSTGSVQSSTIMKGKVTEKRLKIFSNISKAMYCPRQAFLGFDYE